MEELVVSFQCMYMVKLQDSDLIPQVWMYIVSVSVVLVCIIDTRREYHYVYLFSLLVGHISDTLSSSWASF